MGLSDLFFSGLTDNQIERFGREHLDVAYDALEIVDTEEGIQKAFLNHSGLVSFFGALHAAFEAKAARAKHGREMLWADLYLQIRKEAEEEGRKITETTLDSEIKVRSDYVEAVSEEIDARELEGIASALYKAILSQKDMLVGLGANMRVEREKEPVIRETQKWGGRTR